MTLLDVTRLFDTDEKCRELLVRLRWPNGVECPRCSGKAAELATEKQLFYCKECDYQFSVTADTIFHDSHLPLSTWFAAVLLLCEARKGMSAMQLKRTLFGLHKGSYKTAWYLCHRIRAAMAEAERPALEGTVEMDETFIGGFRKRTSGVGPYENKEIVVGIRQRGGDVRFFHASDVKSGTLAQYVKEHISADVEVIMTDDFTSYPKAMISAGVHGSKHKTINHS
ncbi:MAG TPA: IS1595 family transposase, partial [Terriglobales bacterium]|nr:IS1595 family transposase [Terriglobales bacterium]